jgi:hypothetical protein
MMNRHLFFLLFIISNNILFAQNIDRRDHRFYIQAIPYTEYNYSFQIEGRGYNSVLTILGWSRDGKILFRHDEFITLEGDYVSGDYIVDLVTDKIVWEDTDVSHHTFFRTSRKRFFEKIVKQYGIEPVVDEFGAFPFTGPDKRMYNILKEESVETMGHADRLAVRMTIYEMSNSSKRKYINQITELNKPEWLDNDYMWKLQFWYAKSPYENRLAVIAVVPRRQHEFEFTYFGYLIYGTNLDVGF